MFKFSVLILFILCLCVSAKAQVTKNYAVSIHAITQENPPQITLNYGQDVDATSYSLYRKLPADTSWGGLIQSLSITDSLYVDNNVVIGESYEYRIVKQGSNFTGYGYINAGIKLPVVENRGRIILIIDNTHSAALVLELEELTNDLRGDGWIVDRYDVNPALSVAAIKSLIYSSYIQNPTYTRAVFLFGNIPVPYSGQLKPDGHPDHEGAWPADCYYGEMDGVWTDTSINITSASDPRNHNVPGDGKFDQESFIDLELQVGRVDFSDLPSFTQTEQELLRSYLNKNHAFRHKDFIANDQAVVDDNFSTFNEGFAANGYRNFSTFFRSENVIDADYFTSMQNDNYLWSYGCGPGWHTSCNGIGATTDFATDSLGSVFTMLFGSYFGDWDRSDNLLRATLASGSTLTNCWGGRPNWFFHHMALGQHIGYSSLLSQNNTTTYWGGYQKRGVHIALLGDPSLRMHIVAPVSSLSLDTTGNNLLVSWSASVDSVLGYYVYRKEISEDSFQNITNTLVVDTSFLDTCVEAGSYEYMVRALTLQQSASGSYYNLSQGIMDTITVVNELSVLANTTDLSCYNTNDGTAQLLVQNGGGVPPLQILWDVSAGNQTTWNVNNLPAGNHSYTVTDSYGCTNTSLINILGPSNPITGTVIVTDVSCVGCSDGAIQLIAAGGWSNGGNNYEFILTGMNSIANGLPYAGFSAVRSGDTITAGTYTVEIKDYSTTPACSTIINNIVVNEPSGITTVQDGLWSNTSTWVGGVVPSVTDDVTISHHITVNSNLTINGQIIVAGNKSITINNGFNLSHTGALENRGDILGSYTLTGGSRVVNLGDVEDLIVSVAGTISLNADCSISRLLKVDAGATIDVTGYKAKLLASESRTCLVHDNGGFTVGDFIVEQFIPQAGNAYSNIFYSSPVNNATLNQIDDDCILWLSGNPNSYYYDENTGLWSTPTSLSYPLTNGYGFYQYAYIPWIGKIFDFTGTLNTGNISVPITNTNGGGWNIVGNPYPSPIDLFKLWDNGNNPGVFYRYYNNSYNSYIASMGISNPPGVSVNATLMQGFWVREGNGNPGDPVYGTVEFNNSMRVTDPSINVGNFIKTTIPLFSLAMINQYDTVSSVVYFSNAATDSLDGIYDAHYLNGDNSFQFATKTGNTYLSINGLPELDGSSVTIPLYTDISLLDNYTISLTEFSNFTSGTKIMLQDLLLSVSHDLTKGDYSYIGNPVEGNDRFIITVVSAVLSTDKVQDVATFEAYRCFDNLCVTLPKALDKNASINVYNTLGQTIFSSTLEEGKQFWSIENANLSGTNVYFVDIEGYEKSAKIFWE
ncbi:MAG: fibronectin type III domain-containing protein [Saprospiraceae bacterium]|nr:fibronectin type III domain-containing protein [Saprospiraceae bacterium]